MPDLVGDDVLEALSHEAVGELDGTYGGVYLSGLDEAPVIVQLGDIAPYEHRGIDNLAAAGVRPAGAHSVLRRDGDIADTVVLEVVGIEARVIRGEVAYLEGVLEADALEGRIPAQRPLLHSLLPYRGEGVVDVEDDGLDGAHGLTALVGSDVRGHEAEAVREADGLELARLGVVAALARLEDADARITEARRHGLLGQAQDGEGRPKGHGVVLERTAASLRRERQAVAAVDLDGDVVVEALHLTDMRQLTQRTGVDAVAPDTAR